MLLQNGRASHIQETHFFSNFSGTFDNGVFMATHHFGEPLGSSSPWQQPQHDLWCAQHSLLVLGGNPVLASNG